MSLVEMYHDDALLPNHVAEYAATASTDDKKRQKAEYGVDSPGGFLASFPFTPLYAYATLRGKFAVWDAVLPRLPGEVFDGPTLDAGCGRGMVLIKTAQIKAQRHKSNKQPDIPASPAFGIDIFSTMDQTGNHPSATARNVVAERLTDAVVLNTASFLDLPFADNVFTLVTSSLALHNPPADDRRRAIGELVRVLQPGGYLVILDLAGSKMTRMYAKTLKELGCTDVKCEFAGMGCVFGVWHCEIVTARKPESMQ